MAKKAFKDRLNLLINSSNKKITNKMLSQYLNERGVAVSVPYLSQLRSGARNNPSETLIYALADIFDVSFEAFFTPIDQDDYKNKSRRNDLQKINGLHNQKLRQLLVTTIGLSREANDSLFIAATGLRELNGLPRIRPDV